ncbi:MULTISPECIES: ABC transporter substrate-binding protein [unclassified Crossiella]|uniref:ABC transporter substrate-binding protein n=1 Tax=unclassified Crossiella TaxID=2620835 RepID=UPI001FFE6E44|nr:MULTISPECIES: ABC transporter substrate-binding protein [unclassified Crossiella]MCK2241602.1 ABC transporter substrate-binding protein [Crossiella sp. S99.2]MCK2255526.1 ABC transporter substrate-binding protein [Crossiella sp. S99.1]
MRTTGRALLAALLLVTATACGGGGAPDPGRQITLTLNWYPYGEHAPFYHGLKQGIFRKHGINLKIQAGQGSGKTVQAVGGGQTEFGWADTASLLTAVDSGVPVKSLGVYLQTTPASVQFFGDKGFSKPSDLKGRTVALTAGDALSKTFGAFLKQNGMTETDVRIQNIDPAGKIAAVIADRADSLVGNANDQGPTIQDKAKKPVSYLRFADFGLNYYSDGLLTSTALLDKDPDLVKRMVAATTEAWAEAEKNPAAAVESMQGAAEQLPPPAVVLDQFTATRALLRTESTRNLAPGVNIEADWKATIEVFVRTGVLATAKDPSTYWAHTVAAKG